MKRNYKIITLFGTYSAILLISAIIGITVLELKKASYEMPPTNTGVETEVIYLFMPPEETSASSQIPEDKDMVWIVREFENKIGIFTESESLIQVIDVYTKTLPETDQRMLREGIVISSEDELKAIIEDYSS